MFLFLQQLVISVIITLISFAVLFAAAYYLMIIAAFIFSVVGEQTYAEYLRTKADEFATRVFNSIKFILRR